MIMAPNSGGGGYFGDDFYGSFGGFDIGGGGGYDFGGSGGYDFGSDYFGGSDFGRNYSGLDFDAGDFRSFQTEPSDYRSASYDTRADAIAEGKTYQNPYLDTQTGGLKSDTSFDPNVGAPSWLKSALTAASVIPSPIQPIAALANVATNVYDASARGTSMLPSAAGIASLLGQPALAAGINAYGQYEQGNTLGAGLTGLAGLGIATGNPELGQIAGQIGSGLNAYNALQSGDYLSAGLSAAGAIDPSVAKEVTALNTINKGVESGNLSAVLAGAAKLTDSPDLNIAAQGVKLFDAANKNDWGVISDIASGIKQGMSDTFAGLSDFGNITSIGGLFTPQGGFAPGELDRIQMAVGPRDPVGYAPDPKLIGEYGGSGGSGGSGSTTTAQAPAAQPSPAQDNSGLMAMLLAMGLMDSGDQSAAQQAPVAIAQMPTFDVGSMFLSSYLGKPDRQPQSVAELLQAMRTA